MCSKVRADKGDAAAVQREGDSDSALVTAHAQHSARHTGRAHLTNVLLTHKIHFSSSGQEPTKSWSEASKIFSSAWQRTLDCSITLDKSWLAKYYGLLHQLEEVPFNMMDQIHRPSQTI